MSTDLLIFVVVVGLRLFVPLLIPRFPLPAILAALVIDAADQTIFQNNTDLDLTGYQGYDKALDIYYLTIAYLSTMRNWTDPFAFGVARFLWYYRLVGVLLFELFDVRALLIIFPNTFEYFFIAYEAVRLWWNPARLNRRQVIVMAAFIWIFIKLPQEWWIHIAQLDFTDFMKEDIFGVSISTSWGTAIGENLWFAGLLIGICIGISFAVRKIWQEAPAPDWSFTMDVDKTIRQREMAEERNRPPSILSWYTFEKIALVSMVTVIFAQLLPENDNNILGTVAAVSFVVVANSFVGFWFTQRGRSWATTVGEFAVMVVVNLAAALVFIALARSGDERLNEAATVFFVLLLTLIVTMFDRYHRGVPEIVFKRGSLPESAVTK
ncbi:MAG: hypothetical protein CMF24_00005 [Ilumatobacter sp.]|nr:hypothetical protein [Ilumatobacter sp.]